MVEVRQGGVAALWGVACPGGVTCPITHFIAAPGLHGRLPGHDTYTQS